MTLGGWRAEAAGRLDWSVTSTALGDWCGAQASARGRPVGPPSQNLPLTTFQDRRALLSPVSEWVPVDRS